MSQNFIRLFEDVGILDVSEVGGKNASLGEMIRELEEKGISVPGGYIVTATAYRFFLSETGLDGFIKETLKGLNTGDMEDLKERGGKIREKIKSMDFPDSLRDDILKAHDAAEKRYGKGVDFAVRSSATAEDLPDASFAGEHETFLNVRGEGILNAIRSAMASLFTDRAISYRVDKGFDHLKVALSVGVQKMVRSDLGCSGVMFSLDTETGFPGVVLINGSWGLGEMIVQGEVSPDEFLVFKKTLNVSRHSHFKVFRRGCFKPVIDKKLGEKHKKMVYGEDQPTKIVETSQKEKISFVLTDEEILKLAGWAVLIEDHYSKKHGRWTPMDMEWAKDGRENKLYMIQARPETVHAARDFSVFREYSRTQEGEKIVTGASVGNKIAAGKARIIFDPKDIGNFQKGEVLVTGMTDPDWEPIMKIASAIVTDKGGRTSHAAIVSRELGIPAVVGCKDATGKIKTGEQVTVDCSSEEGVVLKGILKFKVMEHNVSSLPQTKTHVMVNIATPQSAFEKSFLPNKGVGLAREEFIIASEIGIHPMALVNFEHLPESLAHKIDVKTVGYKDKVQYFIDKLSYGIAKISASFYPSSVIVRFSDFKTNEYRKLLGGEIYEPEEENPMIGWRGASRYYASDFAPAFILEIKAIKKVIDGFGLTNTMVMVPFCRSVEEGRKVIKIIKENGLSRKTHKELKIYVMCEIPVNVILADQFLDIFDGMSIGSNDLTQLTLGIDRDGNEKIRGIANENDESVKIMISEVIKKCKDRGKYIGICGQAPSDYPEFVRFLVKKGIESISLNPDSLIKTLVMVHKFEQELR
ncbi:phosphoenolpyruvate synthase [Candidatus Daviesbacteria bacterium]|nr:phosphoenolpyruvate synthase [Candidatus Daviesbacteria bacterium]